MPIKNIEIELLLKDYAEYSKISLKFVARESNCGSEFERGKSLMILKVTLLKTRGLTEL